MTANIMQMPEQAPHGDVIQYVIMSKHLLFIHVSTYSLFL